MLGAKGGTWRSKKGGNNSLSYERKKEIQIIFHSSMDVLMNNIFNNNNIHVLAFVQYWTTDLQIL